MSSETEHIRAIYRLLFDVATGRRILERDSTSLPGAFDDIRQKVYALAETLRDLVIACGMVPPYASYEHIVTYVIVLDGHYRIVDVNVKFAERLGYPTETLRSRMFESLLGSDSIIEWQKFITAKHDEAGLFWVVNLFFLAENGSKLPLVCTVFDAVYNDWLFVLSLEAQLVSTIPLADVTTLFEKEVAIIEQVHAYILGHLDEALPSIRRLTSTWGIADYKLRQGFKMYYGRSIYQFYQEERLKKGYHLIISTRLQLKEIAFQCGFSAYINFYKAFKKTYGIAPSELLRP